MHPIRHKSKHTNWIEQSSTATELALWHTQGQTVLRFDGTTTNSKTYLIAIWLHQMLHGTFLPNQFCYGVHQCHLPLRAFSNNAATLTYRTHMAGTRPWLDWVTNNCSHKHGSKNAIPGNEMQGGGRAWPAVSIWTSLIWPPNPWLNSPSCDHASPCNKSIDCSIPSILAQWMTVFSEWLAFWISTVCSNLPKARLQWGCIMQRNQALFNPKTSMLI